MKAGRNGVEGSGFKVAFSTSDCTWVAVLQNGIRIDYLATFFPDKNTATLQIFIDVANEHLGI